MAENKKAETTYRSERERKYYEEVLPKLSAGIKQLGLEMRSNTVLANAGICTIKDLRRVLETGEHIRYLDRQEEEYIIRCLQIKVPKKEAQ
ncbi:MAG: hypothetical protein IJ272_01035 [Clostridia bacterium]|nr:hypothetical protein [Clostridia bacterium]